MVDPRSNERTDGGRDHVEDGRHYQRDDSPDEAIVPKNEGDKETDDPGQDTRYYSDDKSLD